MFDVLLCVVVLSAAVGAQPRGRGPRAGSLESYISSRLAVMPGGPLQLIGAPIILDTALVPDYDFGLQRVDPYGALQNCVLFGVATPSVESPRYCVAMLRAGRIIWMSDFFYSAGVPLKDFKLAFAEDLSAGSKVDLGCSWIEGEGNGPGSVAEYCLYAWTGTSGTRIDPRGPDSSLSIVSPINGVTPVDIDGNGIEDLVVSSINDTSNGKLDSVYAWNGSEYRLSGSLEQAAKGRPFSRADNLKASISARVIPIDAAGRLSYIYTVRNDPSSVQSIHAILIDQQEVNPSTFIVPDGWEGEEYTCYTDEVTRDIRRGQTLKGISNTSLGVPTIASFYVQAENSYIGSGSLQMTRDLSMKNWYANSFRGVTVAPTDPPNPFSATAFLDTIASYTMRSDSLGWITGHDVTRKYLELFDSVRAHVKTIDVAGASKVVDAIVREVDDDIPSSLSGEAYALIRYNVIYLKRRLSGPLALPHFTMQVRTNGKGTVEHWPESAVLDSGSTVQLTAYEDASTDFVGWSGDAGGSANPLTVKMNGNKNIVATFFPKKKK
jgi:hypothetical protein